jgi:hypothetical protein
MRKLVKLRWEMELGIAQASVSLDGNSGDIHRFKIS